MVKELVTDNAKVMLTGPFEGGFFLLEIVPLNHKPLGCFKALPVPLAPAFFAAKIRTAVSTPNGEGSVEPSSSRGSLLVVEEDNVPSRHLLLRGTIVNRTKYCD